MKQDRIVRRLKAGERREQIVHVAFDTIATDGFEGLRTREVADRAGINSATLHHYFPTKADLIDGVAGYLESRYRSERAPTPSGNDHAPTALRQLRQEFADVAFFRREHLQIWAVSREFILRAPRDPTVAAVIFRLNQQWRTQVERILATGRDTGVFRPDLEPDSAATTVIGALWGSTALSPLSDAEFADVCHTLETWLTNHPTASTTETD